MSGVRTPPPLYYTKEVTPWVAIKKRKHQIKYQMISV
jgi:hypothetical protein